MPIEQDPCLCNSDEVPSTPPTERFFTSIDERRRATRFQHEEGTDFAVIWRESGEEILAEVHDESLTGLGIIVDSELGFELGSHVHVVYAGEYLQGQVRHVTMQSEGKHLVGLTCQPNLPEE